VRDGLADDVGGEPGAEAGGDQALLGGVRGGGASRRDRGSDQHLGDGSRGQRGGRAGIRVLRRRRAGEHLGDVVVERR
jgi:hypothetical protein